MRSSSSSSHFFLGATLLVVVAPPLALGGRRTAWLAAATTPMEVDGPLVPSLAVPSSLKQVADDHLRETTTPQDSVVDAACAAGVATFAELAACVEDESGVSRTTTVLAEGIVFARALRAFSSAKVERSIVLTGGELFQHAAKLPCEQEYSYPKLDGNGRALFDAPLVGRGVTLTLSYLQLTGFDGTRNATLRAPLWLTHGASASLKSVHAFANRGLRGGLVAADDARLDVVDSCFSLNTAQDGGVFFVENGRRALTIADSAFVENRAFFTAGAVSLYRVSNVSIQRTVFANNHASRSGAVFVAESSGVSLACVAFNRTGDEEWGYDADVDFLDTVDSLVTVPVAHSDRRSSWSSSSSDSFDGVPVVQDPECPRLETPPELLSQREYK